MAVKYSGLLKFTDEIKAEINLASDGAVEKAVLIDGDGNETLIGGSSDLTTATLSITNNLSDVVDFSVPFIQAPYVDTTGTQVRVNPSSTDTFTVILYKGHAECSLLTRIGADNEATSTGSISGSGSYFEISGNGTITVAAKSNRR